VTKGCQPWVIELGPVGNQRLPADCGSTLGLVKLYFIFFEFFELIYYLFIEVWGMGQGFW
jgi:hypothetical protein